MKLSKDRFSVPSCIFEDDLPDKTFRLLAFLFLQSNVSGMCSPGYAAMKSGADITSNSTVAAALKLLRKHGWFHFVKKGNGRNSVFWLRIPPRFTETDAKKHPLSIRLLPTK